MPRAAKRPIRTMRRDELRAEAKRLGVKNYERYLVSELRVVVAARIVSEGIDPKSKRRL